jgi:putative membrane protein
MKINNQKYPALLSFLFFALSFGCHSGQKDSSTIADSTNKAQIKTTDSADKAQLSISDSSLKASKTLKEDASKFLVKSYESGLYEVQLSQLAATNALDADVKTLAANLINDHISIDVKIKAIATTANFALPEAINADHQKELVDIGKLKGADFDKKYVNTIVSGHESAVSDYKDAYKNLSAGDTKTFAGATLPTIQDHLAMAKKVKDRIK